MELVGKVNNYDWGKLGTQSEAAKLAALNSSEFKADEKTPYSELWMGDHPSGPSVIKSSQVELGKFIADNNGNGLIGDLDKLPFLFKVLSIRKALSIQVHPDKKNAERLNAERPDVYRDPNHKPEIAIALTPFDALCGFRTNEEIEKICTRLPPLSELLGSENVKLLSTGAKGLRTCFEKLMTSPENLTNACIDAIATKYTSVLQEMGLLESFNKIKRDFPGDSGILALFFVNLIRLQPGEAIFLAANEIHAYLEGDCVECMSCSDNVVRAGLTPKYKDVACLIEMLNFEGTPPEMKLFKPTQIDECLERFAPPIKDFAVDKLSIPSSLKEYNLKLDKYGGIMLVLNGERQLVFSDGKELNVQRGSIIFIPGNIGENLTLKVKEGKADNFQGYIAKYNSYL
ncbi:mannose-6-phosphate isomerase [Eupeodes corollae]|uniref:mannose-6-phosphate isomerase n=1 Tax=Eupeodes corollae TaxID=290404 RepID=UPI002490B13A|nr:mannose-6-phosphate isomerase [Eupeodes corollae]